MSTLSLTSADQHRFQAYAAGDEKAEAPTGGNQPGSNK